MILDRLENAGRYLALNPRLVTAFEFLRGKGIADLTAGRHAVQGEQVYATVVKDNGRGPEKARLEVHRKYLDIQFTLSGDEVIGWKSLATCKASDGGYNPARDIEFFADKPDVWLPVPAGSFVIVFPEDAHAPQAGTGPLHKIVMKVALEP